MNIRFVADHVLKAVNRFYSARRCQETVLILNYHSVPDRRSFESQMQVIRESGWPVISLDGLVLWNSGQSLPGPPALVLTFDDCYQNQFTNAVPVLEKFEYPAAFFAVTRWATGRQGGKTSGWAPALPLMGKNEVRELRRRGFAVGSHTRTHPNLAALDAQMQKEEIEAGKSGLEELLNEKVRFFSYPYGRYTPDTVQAVKASGFVAAVSVRVGAVRAKDDLYLLKRLCIPYKATREQLRAQLTWVAQFAETVRRVPWLDKVARAFLEPSRTT